MNILAQLLLLNALPWVAMTYSSGDAAASTQSAMNAVPAAAPVEWVIVVEGAASGLHLGQGGLTFCDKRGRRSLDLQTGRDVELDKTECPLTDDRKFVCDDPDLDVSVRAPPGEVNDVVSVGGSFFSLEGRFRDCAANRMILAVVTGAEVVLIDVAKRARMVIGRPGGDRVTIGPRWIAWSNGSTIHARALGAFPD